MNDPNRELGYGGNNPIAKRTDLAHGPFQR